MPAEVRRIPRAERAAAPPPDRARAEFKSHMVMVRHHVDVVVAEGDKDKGEFFYAQLLEQCRKLARSMGFKLE